MPRLVIWADPSAHTGSEYRRECSNGVVEDVAQIVGLNECFQVPAGTYTGSLKPCDRNALESGAVEFKY